MKPTSEQLAVVAFAELENSSAVINALAGAAKTTTLKLVAQALPASANPVLAIAFNSKIKTDLEKHLPASITCLTFNGLGHRAWASHTKRKLVLNTKKNFEILKAALDDTGLKLTKDEFTSVLDLLSSAKSSGLVPKELSNFSPIGLLPDTDESWERLCVEVDLDWTEQLSKLVRTCLAESVRQSYQGIIDFDDQLYMSVCFNANYPKFKTVLVDEAQDLSPMNHKQVLKSVQPSARVFIFGDRNQSIYAFRGAASNSIDLLAKLFQTSEFKLTTTFRCDQAICEYVRKHVPEIQARANAGAGRVEKLPFWNEQTFPQGSAVLCRNNAPLIFVAMLLLRKGIPVQILGREVGKGLIKKLNNFDAALSGQALRTAIAKYFSRELAKASDAKAKRLADQQDCLLALAEAEPNATCAQLSTRITELFSDKNALVTFATGHKSKGLEWETVFHLDSWRIPTKFAREAEANGNPVPMEQERNLRYVINTRAKKELLFINCDNYGEKP